MSGGREAIAARTREALVTAGIELFTEHGYAGVSTVGLCAHLGVTRGALYHHFPNMSALMEACFERVDHELVEHLAATAREGADDPASRLRDTCREFVDQLAVPPVRQILFTEAPAALGWTRWRELDGGRSLALVRDLLRQVHQAGALRPGHDPDVLAHLLLGALNELAMYVSASRPTARARQAAHAELQAVIDGLLVDRGRTHDRGHE